REAKRRGNLSAVRVSLLFLIPQHASLNLAAVGSRQRSDEFHPSRIEIWRSGALDEIPNVLGQALRGGYTLSQNDECLDHLATQLVRAPDRRTFGYRRVKGKSAFHVPRPYTIPRRTDDVVGSLHEPKISFLIDIAEI